MVKKHTTLENILVQLMLQDDKDTSKIYEAANKIRHILHSDGTDLQKSFTTLEPPLGTHILPPTSRPVQKGSSVDKLSHQDILVTPRKQLQNACVGDLGSLGLCMYGTALVTDNNKDRIDFENTFFKKSFLHKDFGTEFYQYAQDLAKKNGMNKGVIFPPLILRSNENIVVKLDPGRMLVCHETGAVIPLIQRNKIKDSKDLICHLYSLHYQDFVNKDNITQVLESQ